MRRRTITIQDARRVGATSLLIYCNNVAVYCYHQATMPMADFPDDMELSDIERRCRCTRCGARLADVRADYSVITKAAAPKR